MISIMVMDSQEMKRQTLKWCEGVPRNKLNLDKMMVIFENGKIKFVPKHLVL